MASTVGQRHALIGCYGQHSGPVARSNRLLWPTPQATYTLLAEIESGRTITTLLNGKSQGGAVAPNEMVFYQFRPNGGAAGSSLRIDATTEGGEVAVFVRKVCH